MTRTALDDHRRRLPRHDAPLAPGSADRILVYDLMTDEAVWEGRTTIRRCDPIPWRSAFQTDEPCSPEKPWGGAAGHPASARLD